MADHRPRQGRTGSDDGIDGDGAGNGNSKARDRMFVCRGTSGSIAAAGLLQQSELCA
ncbi:hypothetical protein D3C87_2026490 [compost metagenome]